MSFSFSRLIKLINKHFFENTRLYLYSVIALVVTLAMVFAFWALTGGVHYNEESTYVIYLFGLSISGTIFTSMSFNMLNDKPKGVYWLSIPATHLEKLVCHIFYTAIVFTVVFSLCFLAIKTISVSLLQQHFRNNPEFSYDKMDFTRGFGTVIKYFVYAYFAVQAFYLLGSVYFKRFQYILTTIVMAFVFFGFVYYITAIKNAMLSNEMYWNFLDMHSYYDTPKHGYKQYSVSAITASIVKFFVQFGWAPVFWLITWFRLKEKEI